MQPGARISACVRADWQRNSRGMTDKSPVQPGASAQRTTGPCAHDTVTGHWDASSVLGVAGGGRNRWQPESYAVNSQQLYSGVRRTQQRNLSQGVYRCLLDKSIQANLDHFNAQMMLFRKRYDSQPVAPDQHSLGSRVRASRSGSLRSLIGRHRSKGSDDAAARNRDLDSFCFVEKPDTSVSDYADRQSPKGRRYSSVSVEGVVMKRHRSVSTPAALRKHSQASRAGRLDGIRTGRDGVCAKVSRGEKQYCEWYVSSFLYVWGGGDCAGSCYDFRHMASLGEGETM
ncbi:hypothetical protein DL89DRAFT_3805 [Linderina pennispora]|uniref:Uncharacterized protein n=1 Tax=Linderina pennispora TaxID=61395 RepID=A0A1Y1WJQ9_9FUNG|nr:uncharacterized protein DL89DRAFT_3805 [Linderina pennispora]ORX73779.1 hypothetical protein DL89DRAFT_3805 [Linderina pennispora]